MGMFYLHTRDQSSTAPSADGWPAKQEAASKGDEIRAEMNKMKDDFDGDGLTLAEEQRKGTSDLQIDSDGDKIPDPLDLVPQGGRPKCHQAS